MYGCFSLRKKYANKSRGAQIFHRYTGFIIMGIFTAIIATAWIYYDSTLYYFEKWQCPKVTDFAKTDGHLLMTDDEHQRFHESLQICFDSVQFVGDKEH